MPSASRAGAILLLTLGLLAGCTPPDGGAPAADPSPSATASDTTPATATPTPAAPAVPAAPEAVPLPLAGLVIVVDPGHQLGNRNFPREINALVDAGNGGTKACNTTGTATDDGVPEATVTWDVSALVVADLRARGAEVVLTRETNSDDDWGPCIDVRGSTGNDRADLLLSIHADGGPATAHGFHVLLPAVDSPVHDDSLRLGEAVRVGLETAGIDPATYVEGAMRASDDYATLNLSAKPAVIVELGNMRHDGDAAALTDPAGQAVLALALVDAVEAYVVATPTGAP
ncbi:N-acetylmuramoyl-L-alanine amidase [Serinibacter arcticus]|uniref:N-acetylmuramoyl-L-alanine amidase n=1 Tax=Serinibacter arcticus TaxID=1655435 RepID=A0A4Z1E4C2_9MICO|nr:N-acetylmuramoyl-L-alanine amidase [Serinibacter arcticus]TGO05622.1 N-acetylmuramoyl-L-alanine amidase [Serinibacter arcticus]